MAALTLEHAADLLGMPKDILHAMTWAKTGPPSNGSYWFPTFDETELRQWKAANKTGKPLPPGRKIGTKAIYRHRQG